MAKKKTQEPVSIEAEEIIVLEIPKEVQSAMSVYKPEDFNLDQTRANEISEAFKPKLLEMAELLPEVDKIKAKDVDASVSAEAKALRLKFVKIRTSTADVHKEQKEQYLKPGKFIDAWKTAQICASEQIEGDLMAIEKHFERIESERKEKLNSDRVEILKGLGVTNFVMNYGSLSEDVWEKYLEGEKVSIEKRKQDEADRTEAAKVEADRVKAENERLTKEANEKAANDKIHKERLAALNPVRNFLPANFEFSDLHTRKPEELKAAYVEAKRLFDADTKKKAEDEANKKLHEERFKTLTSVASHLPEGFDFADLHLREAAELKSIYISAKTRKDADAAASEKAAKEAEAKTEADRKLSESSDLVRLEAWINAISLPPVKMETLSGGSVAVVTEIELKFVNFKAWALKQIQTL